MKKALLAGCIMAVFSVLHVSAQEISVIPKPNKVQKLKGSFALQAGSKIYIGSATQDMKALGQQLSDKVFAATGLRLPVTAATPAAKGGIILTGKLAADTLGDEGYTLDVTTAAVTIRAPKANGIYYGIQTLQQLLPAKGQKAAIPAVSIVDKPRFAWRGVMLDVGRYFYSVDFIKRYIDQLSRYKINTFHWHLTEDHGWRIEIKKHPRLTQMAAQRDGHQYAHAGVQVNKTPHWGYYTQQQIKEVVAYAQARYVTIVPEIEMPGHSLAALVAYPELSCTGGPFSIWHHWGIQADIFCAGNEQTFTFLTDVLSEVAELFPGRMIHIGGDEAPKDRWKACPKCQARIKAEGLKDEHELQSYFIKRIENFLATKNKSIIGWDEILEGGLAPRAAVMSWRGVQGGIAAAKQHHDAVMSPGDFMYFDHYQGEPYLEPIAIGGFLPLNKVYGYEPVPAELTPEEAKFIKGVQANVWCEFIHSPKRVEYMSFPRVAALSEIGWTQPALKNWEGFKQRMDAEYKYYDKAGIRNAKSAFNVYSTIKTDTAAKKAVVTLATDTYAPQIRYTIDGTEPTAQSPLYKGPFTVNVPVTINASTFVGGKLVGENSVRSVIVPYKE